MKKIICLALALVMCALVLASCDDVTTTAGNGGTGSGTTALTADPNRIAPKADEIDLSELASLDGVTESETPTDYVLIDVKSYGKILIRLYPDVAPASVENFKALVSEKFYDGVIFHRVIKGFMIQGGDPDGTGTGGSGTNIFGEFASNGFVNNLAHKRGVVSMARSGLPNSASSQFFICHADSGVAHLDGDYASFGYVVYGMDTVDKIAKVNVDGNDKPLAKIEMTSVRFANVG